jgi:hypothetical protein
MGSDLDMYALLVEAAVGRRDEAAIRQDAPNLEKMATEVGHTLYQAIAQRAWGVAYRLRDELAAAEHHFNQALGLFEQLDTRWQIGRTLFELGELARTQLQDRTAVRAHFARALTAFEEIQAAPDAGRIQVVLTGL